MSMPEPPNGAIYNGRVFLQRLINNYNFVDEYGYKLSVCHDYQEALRCFEFMAEWIDSVAEGWEPSESQQGLIPIPDGYNEQ